MLFRTAPGGKINPGSLLFSTPEKPGHSTFDSTVPDGSETISTSQVLFGGTPLNNSSKIPAPFFLSPILPRRVIALQNLSESVASTIRSFTQMSELDESSVAEDEVSFRTPTKQTISSRAEMGDSERRALKIAFFVGADIGLEALGLYMRAGRLPEFRDLDEEDIDERSTKDNFRKAIEKICGSKKVFSEETPSTTEPSLDEYLDIIAKARGVVVSPETKPTPKPRFARVLAGAVTAGIPLSSNSTPFSALKKQENVQERLSRWKTINTDVHGSQNPGGLRGSIEMVLENTYSEFSEEKLNSLFQNERKAIEIPKESNTLVEGCTFGVAHLQKKVSPQENTHAQGVVEVGTSKIPFFAVCAGRKGVGASKYVSEHLQKTLQQSLENEDLECISDGQLENILASVSVQLDDKLNDQVDDGSDTALTMALIISREGRRQVWAVNVGNSRTLLVMPNKTHQLTEDALFSNPRFEKSCRKIGIESPQHASMQVQNLGKGVGIRSIGNKGVKKLSSTGKVSKVEGGLDKGALLVLHTDDFNEDFSANDIGDIARNRNFKTAQSKAEALVKTFALSADRRFPSALVVRIPAEKSEN